MKQILYFLIGVLISGCLMMPYANADCGEVVLDSKYSYIGHFADSVAADSALYQETESTIDAYGCPSQYINVMQRQIRVGPNYAQNGVRVGTAWLVWNCNGDGSEHFWYCTFGDKQPCANDTDGDGIPDDYDLKPNSTDSYTAGITTVCYDANNKVVAGIIQDSEGNQYKFGTMPTDLEGYTIEEVSGDLISYQTPEALATSLEKLDIDNFNITNPGTSIEIQDGGTIIPGDSDPFKDWDEAKDDQIEAPKPDTTEALSEQPDANDIDSDRYDKIIKNTSSTNTNLDNVQQYLGITNDYLAKINEKTGSTSSKSTGEVVVTVTTPTADEIGQSVKDKLIDSGQTIDTTITDNIPALNEADTLTTIQTKYSDRFDLFITTLKGSDLFSLPFGIFTGPSGSGVSTQTVNIGKWGSSSEKTATIDYSDYDDVWQILRSVLLLVTSFSCFKILILKKG